MKLNPISEAEALPPGVWKRGMCEFEVIAAIEQTSKAGNEMIKLQLRVTNSEDKTRTMFDYLVSSEGMAYKCRHFAVAVGLLSEYQKGELRALDLLGRTGRLHLGVDKEKDGYPARNSVQDYVSIPPSGTPPVAGSADPELDDEIPF